MNRSYVNLSTDLISQSEFSEGLRVLREGAHSIEQIDWIRIGSAETRKEFVNAYLYFVRGLAGQLDESEEALPMGERAVAWAEQLVHEDSKNVTKQAILRTALKETADAARNTGNIEASIRWYRKLLQFQLANPVEIAGYWQSVAEVEAILGSLHGRAERPQLAEQGWRKAIVTYERACAFSQNRLAKDPKDITAIRGLRDCESSMAPLYEHLGDYRSSQRHTEAALSHAQQMVAMEPGVAENNRLLGTIRARAFRVRWILDGDKADFTPISGGLPAGPERIEEELANGYLATAWNMAATAFDPKGRIVDAQRAVELSRGLFQRVPSIARRELLARCLSQLAVNLLFRSRSLPPKERDQDLARAFEASTESVDLLSLLQLEKSLPTGSIANLNAAKAQLANIEYRIAKLRGQLSSR